MEGKKYVVTGGAGHLGSAICAGLLDAGARVLCLSSKRLDLPGISQAVCDVADEEQVEAFIKSYGPIDGLVNNAVRAPRGIDLEMPREQFLAGLNGILTHYFTCARVARRHMRGGAIVNVASMWGVVSPSPEMYLDLKNEPSVAMAPAAGGILAMTRYLAVLMAKDGIRVNALVPGWFPKKRGPERLDYMKQITDRVPLGRIGKPEELVGPVKFLLSDASSYMTGQQLIIDGGYTVR